MARLMAIDYGLRRVGLAATDNLQIIASPLETVPTPEVYQYLEQYFSTVEVEAIVVGWPTNLDGSPTDSTQAVEKFVKRLKKRFPSYPIHLHDERYTSKMALDAMIAGGTSKKDRRQKGNIDRLSAVIILQSYMESVKYRK